MLLIRLAGYLYLSPYMDVANAFSNFGCVTLIKLF